ncbi:MAG: hypothetical protein Kow0042_07960 [Calditrichia bacterium]
MAKTAFHTTSLVILVCLILSLQATARAGSSVFGLSLGIVRSENSGFYVDDPVNAWLDRSSGLVFSGQYYLQPTELSFVGAYLEYERFNLKKEYEEFAEEENIDADASRVGFGLTWMFRTPENFLKFVVFELGGFGGVALMSVKDFDSLNGFDFGIFFGPVFPFSEKINLALHIADSYGWYHADKPEGVQNVQPKFRIQLYLQR